MLAVVDRSQNAQCIVDCFIWGRVAADQSEWAWISEVFFLVAKPHPLSMPCHRAHIMVITLALTSVASVTRAGTGSSGTGLAVLKTVRVAL